jgi:DNA helicase-4
MAESRPPHTIDEFLDSKTSDAAKRQYLSRVQHQFNSEDFNSHVHLIVDKQRKNEADPGRLANLLTMITEFSRSLGSSLEKLYAGDLAERRRIESFCRKYGLGGKHLIDILLAQDKRLAVVARAGSGKTTALAARVAFLIKEQNVSANAILLLTFNKAAATEINRRLREPPYSIDGFDRSSTFHAFAYALTNLNDRRLSIIGSEDEQFRRIEAAIKSQWSPTFWLAIWLIFRADWQPSEIDLNELVGFRDSDSDVAIDGTEVKSRGEKWIADFLFERGIDYQYEREFRAGSKIYRPDFYISGKGPVPIILEHWAFDPDDPNPSLPKSWTKTAETYLAEIHLKREYWKQNPGILIETSTADMREGRDAFEALLTRKLSRAHIVEDRLSDEQILERLRNTRRAQRRISKLFTDAIGRMKKEADFSIGAVQQRIESFNQWGRSKSFIKLTLNVLKAYEKRNHADGKIDFDDLLRLATNAIERDSDACCFKEQSVRSIKYVLVDEFQDTSENNFKLLNTLLNILEYPTLNCVGDDWQAINGFAGARSEYMTSFSAIFDKAPTMPLPITRRCSRSIVAYSNKFMEDRNGPAVEAVPTAELGLVHSPKYVDDIWLEMRADREGERARDKVFVFKKDGPRFDLGFRMGRTLKFVADSILAEGGGSFFILSRNGNIYGFEHQELAKWWPAIQQSYLGNVDATVTFMTMHKSKGLEADHVVIVQAVDYLMPLIHPYEELFGPWKRPARAVLQEEENLFYVACTRARKTLRFLSEKDRPSPFLEGARQA